MILYVENLKKLHIQKTARTKLVQGCNLNMPKSIVFLYTSNEQFKN